MKVFVYAEAIPTVLAGLVAYNRWQHSTIDLPTAGIILLLGLAVQVIMMLYRILSGFVAFFKTFEHLPTQMAQINQILGRVLGGPRPQDVIRGSQG